MIFLPLFRSEVLNMGVADSDSAWVFAGILLSPGHLHLNYQVKLCLFVTPRTVACQASLSITISWSELKLKSTESVMPSNHLILYRPFLLPPSIFPSIRVFFNELALCIRWPKYWSCSLIISPSNEYSRTISFWIDWFDLAVQGTLKSLFQHHNSKASIFWCFSLHGPTLTSIRDHTCLCRQSDALCFSITAFLVIDFSPTLSIRIYSQIFQNSVNVSALGTQNNHKTISRFSEQRKKHRGQNQTDFGFPSTHSSTGAHVLFYQVSSEPRPSKYYEETSVTNSG